MGRHRGWNDGIREIGRRPPGAALARRLSRIGLPLLARLTPEARQKLLKGNYERLFDEARVRVRALEQAHLHREG